MYAFTHSNTHTCIYTFKHTHTQINYIHFRLHENKIERNNLTYSQYITIKKREDKLK